MQLVKALRGDGENREFLGSVVVESKLQQENTQAQGWTGRPPVMLYCGVGAYR
jgi:hypothetical protein